MELTCLEPNLHGMLKTREGKFIKPFVVAGIPAYNEEKTIARVVLQAQRYVDKVVVCDDGSSDLTDTIAERLGADVVRHERNMGYGASVQSLFKRARQLEADAMVTLHADGQHNPSEIPALLKPILKDDVDIAVGTRFFDKEHRTEDMTLYMRLSAKTITKSASVPVNDEWAVTQHGFQAYGRKALEELKLFEQGMRVCEEVFFKARQLGLRMMEVPVRYGHLAGRVLSKDTTAPRESNLAIVIPTLNEAQGIEKVLEGISKAFGDERVNVLVVDGHSTDGTDEIARKMGAEVIYQRNKGYGDALSTGFTYARKHLDSDVIVMIDGDFTYDPKDMPQLVNPILKDEADLIVGNRFVSMQKGAMPFINRVGNTLLSWFARITLRLKVHDTQCGLRAFRSDLVDYLHLEAEGMPLAIEMLSEAKFAHARVKEVPVTYRRRAGATKLNPLRDGLRILGTMIRLIRDTEPLLFFGAISFVLAIAGLWFGFDVMMEWLRTGSISRVPTVVLSVLLLTAALQFFAISLMADMVKRLRRRHW